eukprot:CAMPEP_0119302064 /NCGR_PEP_ID=MMETSP1333-20130426/3734_1 /TAXON_ID=418940 /ORGANISM="Scyphosphaera apsteinii, Strain RCC1455" /LENGTH=1327 /DNA_ID=CAMNT_0007304311 /DNA_START=67 /DNA_END=4052 /DNA_ORIENTATION=-
MKCFTLFALSLHYAATAAPKPRLGAHTRLLEFGSVTETGGGDTANCVDAHTPAHIIHGLPFSDIHCSNGLLHVDGQAVPSTHLESGELAFIHPGPGSTKHVVITRMPTATKIGEGFAIESYELGAASPDVKNFVATQPIDHYDIFALTSQSQPEYWNELTMTSTITPVGEERFPKIFTQDGLDLSAVASITSPSGTFGMYNISFNNNWPASGNGEYIYAEIELKPDEQGIQNVIVEGVAYKYDPTACMGGCPADSPHFNWRGEKVRLVGALSKTTGKSGATINRKVGWENPQNTDAVLTDQQRTELLDIAAKGRKLQERAIHRRLDSTTCDTESAVDLVKGLVNPNPMNEFNDFWGTACGTDASTMSGWQQDARYELQKVMLWHQAQNTQSVCDEANSDTCTFCIKQKDRGCYKNDDGSNSPASQTSVWDMYQQMDFKSYPVCDTCTTDACRSRCIPNEVVDAVANDANVSRFLEDMSWATLSQQYNAVEALGKGKDKHGDWKEFNDWMYDTWGDATSHHSQAERLEVFFTLSMPSMPGYQKLGKILQRFALRSRMVKAIQTRGAIPAALMENPCLAATSGESGLALFDATDNDAVGKALYEWAISPVDSYANVRSISENCVYPDRVNYMLDLLSPEHPEYVQHVGNTAAIMEVSAHTQWAAFADPDVVSEYLQEYIRTSYHAIYMCNVTLESSAPCKAFHDIDQAIRDHMVDEYHNITAAFDVWPDEEWTADNLVHQLKDDVKLLSLALSRATNSISVWEIYLKQRFPCEDRPCSRFAAVFPVVTRGLFSILRLTAFGLFVSRSVDLFSNGGWKKMTTFEKTTYIGNTIYLSWVVYTDLDRLGVIKLLGSAKDFVANAGRSVRDRIRGQAVQQAAGQEERVALRGGLADVNAFRNYGAIEAEQGMREFMYAGALMNGEMHMYGPAFYLDFEAQARGWAYLGEAISQMASRVGAWFADVFRSIRVGATRLLERSTQFFKGVGQYIADRTVNRLAAWTERALANSERAQALGLKYKGPQAAEFFGEGINFVFNIYAAYTAGQQLGEDKDSCAQPGFKDRNNCNAILAVDYLEFGFDVAAAVTSAVIMTGFAFGLAVGTAIPFLGAAFAVAGVAFAIARAFMETNPAPPIPATIIASSDLFKPFVVTYLANPADVPGYYQLLVQKALDRNTTGTPRAPPLPPAPPPRPLAPPPKPLPPRAPLPSPSPPRPPYPPKPFPPPPQLPCPGTDFETCVALVPCNQDDEAATLTALNVMLSIHVNLIDRMRYPWKGTMALDGQEDTSQHMLCRAICQAESSIRHRATADAKQLVEEAQGGGVMGHTKLWVESWD